jgi:hypothetical protein
MIENLLNECHTLALAIAPELAAEMPLYVVDTDQLCEEICAGCLGWATAGLRSLGLADDLPGWQGPGNVIALDCTAILDHVGPDLFDRFTRNVCIHEAAHLLPALKPVPMPRDFELSSGVKEAALKRLKAGLDGPDQPPGEPGDPHDSRFIRRCCHLFYRACAAGYDVLMPQLFGPFHLWLSRPEFYLAVLLPECIRMHDQSFGTIENEPAPQALMDLWQSDLNFHAKIFGD